MQIKQSDVTGFLIGVILFAIGFAFHDEIFSFFGGL